jgi:hypothetical protein
MRLFGDTKLAQFNPTSKSFLQTPVSTALLPRFVLQEALVMVPRLRRARVIALGGDVAPFNPF